MAPGPRHIPLEVRSQNDPFGRFSDMPNFQDFMRFRAFGTYAWTFYPVFGPFTDETSAVGKLEFGVPEEMSASIAGVPRYGADLSSLTPHFRA